MCGLQVSRGHRQIPLCGQHRSVPQNPTDGVGIGAGCQQVRRRGVAQLVGVKQL
jgi:hypothetical protein